MLAEIIPKVAGLERTEGKYHARPSLAGPERCIRQLVYHAAGAERDAPIGERFILILDDSSWHEYLTADWINKTAYRVHSQGMQVEMVGLSGKIDGVITDMLGVDRLFEHKAINHFTFQRYWNGTFPLDYIAQCCLYIRGLQKVNPSINEALLLIKNKNTAQFLEFVIHYEADTDTVTVTEMTLSTGERKTGGDEPLLRIENIVSDAVNKFDQVEDFAKRRTLPPRPFEFGTDFPCGYCAWNRSCWATYEAEVDALANNEADLTELADTARFYNELGAQIGEMSKQRKEIGNTIKRRLSELQVRHGKAGEYDVELKLKRIAGYTVEERMQEELRVNKFKEKKGGK